MPPRRSVPNPAIGDICHFSIAYKGDNSGINIRQVMLVLDIWYEIFLNLLPLRQVNFAWLQIPVMWSTLPGHLRCV